ncbi:MAG: hypothetical protein ACLRMX_10080 [Lachnospira eligens]
MPRSPKGMENGGWTLNRGMHGGSPKGTEKSGGLDVEAENTRRKSKREEAAADWTLKQRNARRSPKGARKSGGLDVEAEEGAQKSKKKICTWKQPPSRRLFPQIEVIS